MKELFEHYYKTKDINTRNQIVMKYCHYTKSIVSRFFRKGIDQDDLIQEGYLSLIKAVERFDPNKKVKFETYLRKFVIGSIKNLFYHSKWGGIRISKKTVALGGRILKDFSQIDEISEIAESLGVSEEEVNTALEISKCYNLLSLSGSKSRKGSVLEEVIQKEDEGFRFVEAKCTIDDHCLEPIEKKVLQYVYLLGFTLTDIARKTGKTKQSISYIKEKAIKKLQTTI